MRYHAKLQLAPSLTWTEARREPGRTLSKPLRRTMGFPRFRLGVYNRRGGHSSSPLVQPCALVDNEMGLQRHTRPMLNAAAGFMTSSSEFPQLLPFVFRTAPTEHKRVHLAIRPRFFG